MARALAAALVAGALASTPGSSFAQGRTLRWDAPRDMTTTLFGATFYLAGLGFEPEFAPPTCRWCTPPSFDLRARQAIVWRDVSLAQTLSDVSAFLIVPGLAVGTDAAAAAHDHASGSVGVDTLVMFQATMLALDAVEVLKLTVARERPHAHALRMDATPGHRSSADAYGSFYSGHTSADFALAAASGTVATMRGYRWAPLTWATSGAVALGTGYLRMAADRHWLSDVLVGMLTGIAIGIVVPLVLHAPQSP